MTDNGLVDINELVEVVAKVHTSIVVDPDLPIIFRPADLRVIRAMTGKDLTAMIQDGSYDADRFCALAFLQLRREHRDRAAKELWDLVEEADIVMVAPKADPKVDPTGGDIGTVSPPSAISGI